MFAFLGKLVSRAWWLMILIWVIIAVWITQAAPPIESVTTEGPGVSLPEGYDSREADKILAEAFGQESSRLIVLFGSKEPLTQVQGALISQVVDNITTVLGPGGRRDRHPVVSMVLSPFDRPYLKDRLTSTDNTMVMCAVALKTGFVDVRTHGYIDGVVRTLNEFRAAHPDIKYYITDSAAIGRDYEIEADNSLHRTRVATILLVVVILVLVYRSFLAPIITLLTVVLSLHVATCVMAIAGQEKWVEVPKLVPVYMLVIMYGAVTDYCMFIIGRFREEMSRGHSRFEAVRIAVTQVGAATLTSAGTTIAGLCMMYFAEFPIFRSTGPVLGVGLAVGLVASLTFAPALVVLLGKHLFWPKKDIALVEIEQTTSGRFWGRFAGFVIRRPGLVLAIALLFFLPFAIYGGAVRPTYDIFTELPSNASSVVGNNMIMKKFAENSRSEQLTVVLKVPPPAPAPEMDNLTEGEKPRPPRAKDYFKSWEGLRLVDNISQAVTNLSDEVIEVRSITRPIGRMEPPVREFITMEDDRLRRLKANTVLWLAYPTYENHDGDITRIDIVLKDVPFAPAAVAMTDKVRDVVEKQLDAVGLKGEATLHIGGVSAQMHDLTKITRTDLNRLRWLVLGALYIILTLMLRGGIAPIYLLATMVLNYFATVGIIQLIFVNILGHEGLDWKVEFFLFVLLVAIGVDYNIYIMSRLREETKRRPFRQALFHAVVFTGGIISSCGLIMAGTFGSMCRSTLAVMVELGMAMALGVLTDTFIVRPLVVPALALLVERTKEYFRGIRPPG